MSLYLITILWLSEGGKDYCTALGQDPESSNEYVHTIKDQLEKVIIEVVTKRESQPAQIHYLPHHAAVWCDRTTTKLRVVCYASIYQVWWTIVKRMPAQRTQI